MVCNQGYTVATTPGKGRSGTRHLITKRIWNRNSRKPFLPKKVPILKSMFDSGKFANRDENLVFYEINHVFSGRKNIAIKLRPWHTFIRSDIANHQRGKIEKSTSNLFFTKKSKGFRRVERNIIFHKRYLPHVVYHSNGLETVELAVIPLSKSWKTGM